MGPESLHVEWTSDRTLRASCAASLPEGLRAALMDSNWGVHLGAIDVAFTLEAAQFTFPALRVAQPEVRGRLMSEVGAHLGGAVAGAARVGCTVEIPVCYDPELGPDVAGVGERIGVAADDVADLHAMGEYTADFLGFSPGFAYLSGLPAAMHVPRRGSPRARVEPGSVAIAGARCAVYPSATPGGWNIIGRTPLRLFDAHREPACLIPPLARVRFRRIDRGTFEAMLGLDVVERPPPRTGGNGLVIESAGALSHVQDLGRSNLGVFGIPRGGPMDACGQRWANAAAGNGASAATIEFIGAGLSFAAAKDCRIGLSPGVTTVVERKGTGVCEQTVSMVELCRGDRLSVRGVGSRCGYVSARGGFDVPMVLGSRSTAMRAGFGGFGGRGLVKGDCVAILTDGADGADGPGGGRIGAMKCLDGRQVIRMTTGFHAWLFGARLFNEGALARFVATIFRVSASSDRAGLRLEGPAFSHGHAQLGSEPTTAGAVQLPPDGLPIILGPDGPVTGGYPVIGVVIEADLARVGRLKPGEYVRFEVVSLDDAWELAREGCGG